MSAQLYIFAGAPKCGSTWLYDQFRRHPEVTVGRIKDPYYFDRHHDRGDDWYWSLFGVRSGALLNGTYADLSHDYLYEPEFPARAKSTAASRGTDLFVHVVLRNPVDRVLSAVRYQISFEGRRRPGALCDGYPKMVAESMYSEHVGRLLRSFPSDRVRVDLFDDLEEDPRLLIGEVCSWLSISQDGEWLDVSPSRRRRAPRRPGFALHARRAGTVMRRAGLVRLVAAAKTSSTVERLLFRSHDGDDLERDLDLEAAITVLEPDVAALSRLLGRDLLSMWGFRA